MEKIISVSTMRASDAAEIAGGTDSKLLMYRAGLGIFHSCDWRGKIDIVAGSGNNAGDGYVLALLLHRAGISCRIVRTSPKLSPDGAFYLFLKSPEPAARAFCRRAMDYDILLVPGDDFGCPGYARLAYCVARSQLERSLPAFRKLAESYGLSK